VVKWKVYGGGCPKSAKAGIQRHEEQPRRAGFERGDELNERTIDALQRALEAAGVEFTNGDQPGVRLTKASPASSAEPAGASNPTAAAKTVRGKTPKATEKKRLIPRRLRHQATLAMLRRALEVAGVEFIDENGGSPGVRLRKRQRAKPPSDRCPARHRCASGECPRQSAGQNAAA